MPDGSSDDLARVYGMYRLLPTVAEYLRATRQVLEQPRAEEQAQWTEALDMLVRQVEGCDWPEPRLLDGGGSMRTAIEYVVDMEPDALRRAYEEGPTPEQDRRDVLDELLATASHLRRVKQLEDQPSADVVWRAERQAAEREAAERRERMRRWRSSY